MSARGGARPDAAGTPLLSADGLAIARDGRTLASGLELRLRRGEVVALLGPNGAGKSTLLAVLAGLLAPAAGRVQAHGRVAASLQAPALARRSVRANVEAALAWWGVPRGERGERALAALATLGVERLAERPAGALSGGEARRVHLARALALRAEVLLLDEPFAGLDAPTRAELLHDAATLLRDPARATLIVVHDRAEAWALADRVAILLDGQLVSGPTATVLERPANAPLARFLGFTGALREPGGTVLRLRPAHVALDPGGPLHGRVVRRIPEEDGLLCELELEHGRLQVRAPYPGPADGEVVRVRLDGGARVAADGSHDDRAAGARAAAADAAGTDARGGER